MIEVQDLTVSYGSGRRLLAVDRVSFHVPQGELLAIVGPSGCGKSSVLFALDGLLPLTGGSIHIGGEPVRGIRRDVALILQDAGLLPWKTVRQNAELGLRVQRRRADVGGVLDQLGLANFERHFPGELSEGMKRRVGIARALALRPQVLLMDEPMANLDSLTRERIQNLILELWRELGLTGVLVTHDVEEAAFLGRRVLVLTARPASVRAVVDNPGMGTAGYRDSDDFQALTRQLRQLLLEVAA
ncbi:MAG: ABC transporter ATP-binding protein [Candidatus Bipolaricaulaceae bacterium]